MCLKDQDGDVFFDKLNFRFLQMPLFDKEEHELETKFDKWCYFLKNLVNFDHIPEILNEPVFQKAFEVAELANLSPTQRDSYEENLIHYWDMKNVIDTAVEEAYEKKDIEYVSRAIGKGFDNVVVSELTGLNEDTVEKIRQKLNPTIN